MRISRFFLATLIVAGISLVLYIVFAGVRLELENQSGQDITNIQVDYRRGSVHVANLSDNEVFTKALGKIGEGATFDVGWEEKPGLNRKVRSTVYFSGEIGYEIVRVKFLPGGQCELLYKGRAYHADERT